MEGSRFVSSQEGFNSKIQITEEGKNSKPEERKMEITQSSENIQSEQQRENGLWGVGMDRASTDCDHNQRSNMYVV